jgi:hypothetical protein
LPQPFVQVAVVFAAATDVNRTMKKRAEKAALRVFLIDDFISGKNARRWIADVSRTSRRIIVADWRGKENSSVRLGMTSTEFALRNVG